MNLIKHKKIKIIKASIKMTIVVLMVFCFRDSYSQIPNDFKKFNVFGLDSLAREKYAYTINSAQDWKVYIENDSLKIGKKYYKQDLSKLSLPPKYDSIGSMGVKGDIVSVKVFNGWIVGVDAGEWGGNLKWYSENGKNNYQIFGMVHQLEKYNSSVFALNGIYHMGLSEGNLVEIKFNKQENKWVPTIFYKSEKYPFAFIRVDRDIYLLTASDLIKINQNKKVQTLITNGFWYLAYPNSMVFYKGSIYIGMRGGIMKITNNNGQISKEWYENKIKIY